MAVPAPNLTCDNDCGACEGEGVRMLGARVVGDSFEYDYVVCHCVRVRVSVRAKVEVDGG